MLIWLWLEDGEHWPLGLATLLSAGAILTKREGLLFVTCAIGAGALASWSKRRSAWPRLGISFLVSAGAWIVWAIWLSTHQLHSNGPESGLGFITDLQRAWDSVSVVANNVFDFDLWLLATTLAIAALCLALLARTYRGAVYLGSFLSLTTAAAVVVLWSTSSLTLTDASVVSRLIGTIAISAAALTPFLLQHLLDAGEITGLTSRPSPIAPRARRGTLVAGAIVVAAAGLYPATVIAKGRPRFPNSSDCVIPAGENAVVRVVFGYADSYSSALLLRDRVHGSGFRNTSVEQDGCGRLRVFGSRSVSRIDSESISRRAGAKGLTPTFELPPSN